MSDLLNNDYTIEDLIEEAAQNEVKRGRGALKGRPKPEGSGIKKGTRHRTTLEREAAFEWIVQKLDDNIDESDLAALTPYEKMQLRIRLEKFYRPELSAIKQQTIILHQYDPTSLTEEQLDVLMTIPVTHSIGEVIETNIPESDVPECIENETTENPTN